MQTMSAETVLAGLWSILSFILLLPFNPKTTRDFSSKYDYIVVGAGSAGSVVAARLSEDPCVTVLLLEAGPDANRSREVPALTLLTLSPENSWNFKSVPQRRASQMPGNKEFPIYIGKGLGGTGLISDMKYVRGNRRDYDSWAANGAAGWSWKDVFPYFLKSEDNTDPEISRNGYHNRGGYLTVSSVQYHSPLISAFAEAAAERGYEYRDINAEKQTGYFKIQGNVRNGRRCTSSKAFLIPAQVRENLDIVKEALVTKVLINNRNEAYGVIFELDNEEYEVYSEKEVIVSAGTVNSAKLLMLSGIGPRKHLEKIGIPVIADLPVGDNFHDHVGTGFLHFEASGSKDLIKILFTNTSRWIAEYNVFGSGALANIAGTEGMAFINTNSNDPSLDWPDIEIHLSSLTGANVMYGNVPIQNEVYKTVYAPYSERNTFSFAPVVARPKSRGTVRLASDNPKDAPLVDFNFFQVDEDINKLVEGMRECVNIVTKTDAFHKIGAKMFETKFPGCDKYEIYSDDYLRCIGQNYTIALYNLVGTCKMGSIHDKSAVVDSHLKIINVDRIRVVDGSIMPHIITGNVNAAITMIAEKASDMIKKDNPNILNCF